MPAHAVTQRTQGRIPARDGPIAHTVRPVGRFVLHYIEMCAVMCIGALVLSVLFFGAAGLLGYTDMPQQYPELSVLVIAIDLSVPMAAWMRFRGMDWQPTLEMAGSTIGARPHGEPRWGRDRRAVDRGIGAGLGWCTISMTAQARSLWLWLPWMRYRRNSLAPFPT
jgi:hypothetical protein